MLKQNNRLQLQLPIDPVEDLHKDSSEVSMQDARRISNLGCCRRSLLRYYRYEMLSVAKLHV